MAYTVWSHGRLLGTSALSDPTASARWRTGFFVPTPLCEEVMPILTGVRRQVSELARVALSIPLIVASEGDARLERIDSRLRTTKEYEAVVQARTALEALALELRAANGLVLATEAIEIGDSLFVSPDVWGSDSGLYRSTATSSSDEFRLYHIIVALDRTRERGRNAKPWELTPDCAAG